MTIGHSTPLYEAIMNTPKEPKVKTPTIDAYDGTSDSDMHLLAIVTICTCKEQTKKLVASIYSIHYKG